MEHSSSIEQLKDAIMHGNIEKFKKIIKIRHLTIDVLNHTYILHDAVEYRCIDICEYLIEFGVDINNQDVLLHTPLHEAARWNYLDICEYLLKQGALINMKDTHGDTPLHYTANVQCIDMCKLLLMYGADPDIKNNNGDTFRDMTKSEEIKCLGSGDKTKVCRQNIR